LEEIRASWEMLEAEARKAHPSLVLLRGYEVMLDVPDPVLTDPRIHLADTSFVLVEWPRLQVPPATASVLGTFRDLGVRVILAHPERYRGLDSELRMAGGWREMGALLQVNYGSLVGRYGDGARKRAVTLLERGWADLFATDFHGRAHLPLYIREAEETMARIDGGEQFELMAKRNPALVLEGGDPLPVPPLSGKKGLWGRLADLFRKRARG
jgi:protein-tyrosine phosphatase